MDKARVSPLIFQRCRADTSGGELGTEGGRLRIFKTPFFTYDLLSARASTTTLSADAFRAPAARLALPMVMMTLMTFMTLTIHSVHADNAAVSTISDDDCSTTATLSNGEVTCSGTKTLVKAAQITNQVGQTAAAGVVNAMGAAAQQKAQQSGNISEMQRAAADIADNGANAQIAQGSLNAALGTWQLIQAQKLSNAAKQLKSQTAAVQVTGNRVGLEGDGQAEGKGGYVTSSNAPAFNAISAYRLNENYEIKTEISATETKYYQQAMANLNRGAPPTTPAEIAQRKSDLETKEAYEAKSAKRESEIKAKEKRIKTDVAMKGLQAYSEAKGVSNEALTAGGASLITGLGQLAAGAINKKAAQNLRDAAGVKLNTGTGTTFQPTGAFGKYDMDTQMASQNSVINGSGEVNPTQQSAEKEKEKDAQVNTDFDLGPGGTGPKDGSKVVGGGPPAGGFQVGQQGGVVSGGGGGGGGGSTSAATPESEPGTQPTMADGKKKNSDSYAQTGAFFTPSGGGGKPGDNSAGGPDLSNLLAQFMPKKEDEGAKNGILDFGGGPGRSPASEAPYSFLDKRTNLFDNIHRAYQDANKRGAL